MVSEPRSVANDEWTLIIAMDCQALGEPPEVVSLAGMGDMAIGRGAQRRLLVQGVQSRLELVDRWISHDHLRITRAGDGWSLEDGGSTNGSRVNGQRVYSRRALRDGDIIQCGGTYLAMRMRTRPVEPSSLADVAERPEILRTLSPAFDHELKVMCKVAQSALPVLLLGESGTGKERIAREIHQLSGRAGPFVALNCGAIPATLVESELFGTRRGAFSGAEDRPGLIRSALHGTLFLDEVAELPVAAQASLLRVLQEKELIPLGASRPISVDIRLVAATNRPIPQFIAEGKLRHDFYARLSNYEVYLPALRERREDLGLLIASLIARHSPSPRKLSPAAALALFTYDWPLNIRELEQCIVAAITVGEDEIDVQHLPPAVREAGRIHKVQSEDERASLIARLRVHGGNVSALARELATTRSRVYRMLDRHAIHREDL